MEAKKNKESKENGQKGNKPKPALTSRPHPLDGAPAPPFLNGEVFRWWCTRATLFLNAHDKDMARPRDGGGAPPRQRIRRKQGKTKRVVLLSDGQICVGRIPRKIQRKPSNISSTTQPPSHSQTRLSLSSNLPQNPSRPHHCRRPIKEPTIAGSLTPPRRRRPLRTARRVHVLPVEEEREGAIPPCLAAAAAPCHRRSSSGSQFRAPPPLSPDPRRRSPPPSLALSAPPYHRCSPPVLAQQQEVK
ncbi:hypothetical protein PIB30_045425 [Stylosanthes scabra]|uniref:Uncharacterized protein n=1 Tax=Stylosanthes scabra TaxID=79078 RepID=A0ABU6QFK8_9FABA|nr:hypothetical protein [Stylosanthes scabra]